MFIKYIRTSHILFFVFFSSGMIEAAVAENMTSPRYRISSNNQLITLWNLHPDTDCHLAPESIIGIIVKRNFAEDQLRINGFVLEQNNGVRAFYNVEPDLTDINMVTLQWTNQGLQQLVRVGHKVIIKVKLCGAAGRVMMVDRITGSRQ